MGKEDVKKAAFMVAVFIVAMAVIHRAKPVNELVYGKRTAG